MSIRLETIDNDFFDIHIVMVLDAKIDNDVHNIRYKKCSMWLTLTVFCSQALPALYVSWYTTYGNCGVNVKDRVTSDKGFY
jgi:hypothetical protein